MKVKGFILLLLALSVCTAMNAQQEERITIAFERENVNQILKALSKECRLKIAYDSRVFRKAESGPFTFKDALPEDVLRAVLSPHGYRTDRVASVWLVVPDEKTPDTPAAVKTDISFTGRVVDDYTGEGMPGATLRVQSTGKTVGSGAEGYFHLTAIPFDTSLVVVSFVGYVSGRVRPNQSKSDTGLTIRLRRNLSALPPAIVTSEPALLLTGGIRSGTVMDAVVARSMAGTGEPDIMRAVQMMSGVSATSELGSGLEIRGSSEALSLTTLDGFTLYHTDHFFGNVGAVNPDFVRSATVFKGSVPADKGGTAAGLLELTGRNGNRYREQVKAGISALSGHCTLSLPLKENQGAVVFSGRRSFTDLIPSPVYQRMFSTTFSAGVPLSNDPNHAGAQQDFAYSDAAIRVHFDASPDKQINMTVLTGRDRLELAYEDPVALPGFRFAYDETSEWGHTGASVSMTDKWKSDMVSSLTVFGSRFNSEARAANLRENLWFGNTDTLFSRQSNRISDVGARYGMTWNSKKSEWSGGVELKQVEVNYRSFLPNNLAAEATDNTSRLAAGYAQRRQTFDTKTTLTVGLRAEVRDFEKLYPAGHLSVRQELTERLSLTAEAGRQNMFVQRLTRQNIGLSEPILWQTADDRNVMVTRSDQASVGLLFESEKHHFSTEIYARNSAGINVHLSTLPVINVQSNLPAILHGQGYSRGLDVMYSYGADGHKVIASGTLGISVLHLEEVQKEVFYAPAHQLAQLKCLYGYKWRLWEISVTAVYGSGRPYTPLRGSYVIPLVNGSSREIIVFGAPGSGVLPAYHRADLLLSRHFDFEKFSGTAGINVYNVYNRRNVRDVRYFAVGSPDQTERFELLTNQIGMLGRLIGVLVTIEI